jgi:uncharacterized protein (TIGR03435 family)
MEDPILECAVSAPPDCELYGRGSTHHAGQRAHNRRKPSVARNRFLSDNSAPRALHLGLLMMVAIGVASAQTATPDRLTFEVASVKPAKSAGGRFTMNGGPGTGDPGRIAYTNIMLRRILLSAYEVRSYQISGPDWLDSLRFDITAKVPDGATQEQFQSMLRNLLETRFKMTIHRESKELPIYALLTAKNGPKVKAIVDDGSGKQPDDQLAMIQPVEGKDGFPTLALRTPGLVSETKSGRARVTAKETPLSKLADLLSGQLGRPVIDMTGLTGNYSFVLYFTPDDQNPDGGSDPSIFGALQEQLGLRLEARKAPVELLVIDHAEKVPTGN